MGGLGGSVATVAGISPEPSPSRQVNRGQAPVTAPSKLDTRVLPRLDAVSSFCRSRGWSGIPMLEKVQNEVSRCELPSKIDRAETVDLYQTGTAGSRFVKISQFRARKKSKLIRGQFGRNLPNGDQIQHTTHPSPPSSVPIPTRRRPVPVRRCGAIGRGV